jgi:hypothetical protein
MRGIVIYLVDKNNYENQSKHAHLLMLGSFSLLM